MKKKGLVVLCSTLIFILGAGFAFVVTKKTKVPLGNIQESITEDIEVSPNDSLAYKFLPNPEIYSKYSSYGITISDDGKELLYNGQKIRLFIDENSDDETFYLDEEGVVDLAVTRKSDGNITDIERISDQKAQEYCSSFFANDVNTARNTQNIAYQNKYDQYSEYDTIFLPDSQILQYKDQRVKGFVDMNVDGSFETYWFDENGTVNLSVVRDSAGKIIRIDSISEKQAQEYQSMVDEYEKSALDGLDAKTEDKMKELYLDNFDVVEDEVDEVAKRANIDSIVDSYYQGKSSRAYVMWQKSIFKKLLTQWVPESVVNPTYNYESFSQYSISGSNKQNLYVCTFSSENNKNGFVVMEYTGDGLRKDGLYMTSHIYDLNENISTIIEGLNETNLNLSTTTASRMRLNGNEVIVFIDTSEKSYACYLDDFSFEQL